MHKVTDKYFTREDARLFKTDWKKVLCKDGYARITKLLLPHGSTGPATATRRTLLPWFIKIQEDRESLEILESGTVRILLRRTPLFCLARAHPLVTLSTTAGFPMPHHSPSSFCCHTPSADAWYFLFFQQAIPEAFFSTGHFIGILFNRLSF